MKKLEENSLSVLLESIYNKYHKSSFIHPDPIEFLYNYQKTQDREIAGLLAASLATGRVNLILKAVQQVLEKLPSPFENLHDMREKDIKELFSSFKYRFYDNDSVTDFMVSVKRITEEYGSLNSLFVHS